MSHKTALDSAIKAHEERIKDKINILTRYAIDQESKETVIESISSLIDYLDSNLDASKDWTGIV